MVQPIYIGVDPAFREGGFHIAILDMVRKEIRFVGFDDVFEWHEWIRSDECPEGCFICVENSNLQNKTFDMSGSSQRVARFSRNAGANQAVSQLAYDTALKAFGPGRVFGVSPKEKGAKIADKNQFSAWLRSFGIVPPKTTNQDQRDAAKLAAICSTIARQKSWQKLQNPN